MSVNVNPSGFCHQDRFLHIWRANKERLCLLIPEGEIWVTAAEQEVKKKKKKTKQEQRRKVQTDEEERMDGGWFLKCFGKIFHSSWTLQPLPTVYFVDISYDRPTQNGALS